MELLNYTIYFCEIIAPLVSEGYVGIEKLYMLLQR